MEKERRRQALQNYLLYLQQDIEREIKGREGTTVQARLMFSFTVLAELGCGRPYGVCTCCRHVLEAPSG